MQYYRGWLAVLLLMFSSIQIYTAWNWGLPGYHSWAVDSQGGMKIVLWVQDRLQYSGWEGRYPPAHKYLLAATYTPVVVWHWLRGKNASERTLRERKNVLPTVLIRLGRLLTILMAVLLILLVFRIGNLLGPMGGGLLAAGFWTGSYVAAYYSQTTNLDVPSLFWSILSLERLLAFRRTGGMRSLIGSAIAAAIAVATKDQAAAFIVSFPILLLWCSHKDTDLRQESSKVRWKQAGLFLLVTLVAYGMLSQAFWRPANYYEHIQSVFGDSLTHYQHHMGLVESTSAFVVVFWQSAHPAVCVFLLLGALALVVETPRVCLWLATIIAMYHAMFILPARLSGARFVLPHLTILAIIAGIGITGRLPLNNRAIAIPVLTFVIYLSSLSLNQSLWNDPREAAERWLEENPAVRKSLATHCPIKAYLPPSAQLSAKWIEPVDGRPVEFQQKYLIWVSAYYDRYASGPRSEEWKQLLDGRSGLRILAKFSPGFTAFPWMDISRRKPDIPGLGQSIYILQRVSSASGASKTGL